MALNIETTVHDLKMFGKQKLVFSIKIFNKIELLVFKALQFLFMLFWYIYYLLFYFIFYCVWKSYFF